MGSQNITAHKHEVTTSPVEAPAMEAHRLIASVRFEEDNCVIFGGNPDEPGAHYWKVLNCCSRLQEVSEEPLEPGDVFKLGRVKFKVVSLSCASRSSEPLEVEETQCAVEPEVQCRVCFGDESSTVDPLVSVCKCRGTLQFIHLSCLKHIILSRSSSFTHHSSSTYTWLDINCRVVGSSRRRLRLLT
jgi:hypothetical protein